LESTPPHILVAPLNWGLGHATRSIPVINQLLIWGFKVSIASDGAALKLLKAEFPNLQAFELPGYGTQYKTMHLALNLFFQMPAMFFAIKKEHKMLTSLIQDQSIDAIISDNRFGLYSDIIPSAIITHQVDIPIDIPILHSLVNRLNRFYLKRFGAVWVPDFAKGKTLSGRMSHHTPMDNDLSYLGPVSRMVKSVQDPKIEWDILVLLSGTEPQRTALEHILLRQLADLPYKTIFVQGITNQRQRIKCSPKLEMVSYLTGKELNQLMERSEIVITRSGYTTLMDLAVLGKKAILIPTPGQREQELLATQFHKEKVFYGVDQKDIYLYRDIPLARQFSGLQLETTDFTHMECVLKQWLLQHGLWKKEDVKTKYRVTA
jgi:uncharacterized protein (TIGR00661 family)